MNERLIAWCLRWLKIEPVPAPVQADETVRVIRKSRRPYKLKLLNWAFSQSVAFLFIIIFFNLGWVITRFNPFGVFTFVEFGEQLQNGIFEFLSRAIYDEATWPVNPFSASAIIFYEWLGLTLFFIQAGISFLPVWLRLDYHATWYLIENDRIRTFSGLLTRREQTTRLANIQALDLKRNPWQTLLGLSTVELRTAGGGQKSDDDGDSNRVMRLQDIENGDEVAQLIRQRMQRPQPAPQLPAADLAQPLLGAAERLLVETKALRQLVRDV